MRMTIKESWEGATGGWGADNRRARRINRKRFKRQAQAEIAEATAPASWQDLLHPGQCFRCGSYDCDLH